MTPSMGTQIQAYQRPPVPNRLSYNASVFSGITSNSTTQKPEIIPGGYESDDEEFPDVFVGGLTEEPPEDVAYMKKHRETQTKFPISEGLHRETKGNQEMALLTTRHNTPVSDGSYSHDSDPLDDMCTPEMVDASLVEDVFLSTSQAHEESALNLQVPGTTVINSTQNFDQSGPPDLDIPQHFPRLEEEKIITIHHEDANLFPDIYKYDPCYDVYLKSLPQIPAESEPYGDLTISEGQQTGERIQPPHLQSGEFTVDYSFANHRVTTLLANTPSHEPRGNPSDTTDREPTLYESLYFLHTHPHVSTDMFRGLGTAAVPELVAVEEVNALPLQLPQHFIPAAIPLIGTSQLMDSTPATSSEGSDDSTMEVLCSVPIMNCLGKKLRIQRQSLKPTRTPSPKVVKMKVPSRITSLAKLPNKPMSATEFASSLKIQRDPRRKPVLQRQASVLTRDQLPLNEMEFYNLLDSL
jgi:hypothetical protein